MIHHYLMKKTEKVTVRQKITVFLAIPSVLCYSCYVVFTFHHKNRPEVSAYQNLRL